MGGEATTHRHLDDLPRGQLGEADNLASVLDEWLLRLHGTTSSHHGVGLLLDLLETAGYHIVPTKE